MTPRSTGLICAIAAVTIFSMQDGISKHLGSAYPPIFITMIRYWAFAGFAFALASRSAGGVKVAANANRPWLQVARGALLAVQIVISIFSFSHVGLAASHTMFAATPLVVACLSVPFLGEKVGWRRWTAIGVGFIGILLIVNPLNATFDARIVIPMVATLMFGLYSVMTRLASRTDTSDTAFFYTGVVGAVTITVVGPFYWTQVTPADWLWMLVLCITGISGHYLLIRAFNLLDAVVVQPMSYIQSVLVCLIGVFVFGEVMTANMIFGVTIVIGAGIFTIWREARLGRARPPAIDPPGTP
ncbi:DMT family transporter [Neorhizobium galegae]|uniref:DMT family transporter n=1 Tax=Neorhizobium galegae TaxID=399 RepID=UPI0006225B64|nr:DMT family transporter [Neorhizobium galegae]KAB1126452.1 DMT family transporter [Neorhizobium galegae]MCQ1805433.1 DMT family transporter [Neorhizobium galegae]CDZ62454.1 DMT(Drug/metabolite transporter) superfamily permease [Neorhizobium galegae bv. orientalis]CDZ71584.1 DMT(Drug/metabolite transporter) superfamily permease [Neorhizobium galegae bv. orientalis]